MAVTKISQSTIVNSKKYKNLSNDVKAIASGGTVTKVPGYTVHTFTGSGTFEIEWLSEDDISIEYLVVAGGAGSGSLGGGGAGGYRIAGAAESTPGKSGQNAAIESPLSLGRGSYTVAIGAGGASRSPGATSSFHTISCVGGGRGGDRGQSGTSGGSGGGGGSSNPSGFGGGAGTAAQGNNGGTGGGDAGGAGWAGGGGGAAGGGSSGGPAGIANQKGGDGQSTYIRGTLEYFAGGGGPSRNSYGGVVPGGIGGGGNTSSDGEVNTGGGGGGGTRSGGSGIVIVRYPS